MLNETNEFVGLADWQAATLFLGFSDDNEPVEELLAVIKKNSEDPTSKESKDRWASLHKAIIEFDLNEIRQIGVREKGSNLPWPLKLRKQGERYHRALRRFFI